MNNIQILYSMIRCTKDEQSFHPAKNIKDLNNPNTKEILNLSVWLKHLLILQFNDTENAEAESANVIKIISIIDI